MSQQSKCPIWDTVCTQENIDKLSEKPFVTYVQYSPRAGGSYKLDWNTKHAVEALSEPEKARLTTWLIDQREQSGQPENLNNWPTITESVVSYTKNRDDLQPHKRADRLLRFIARKTPTVGMSLSVKEFHQYEALAWSESIRWQEVEYLLNYLVENGLLETNPPAEESYTVTVSGYGRIGDQFTNVISSQAFVAMWFHKSMNEAYENGIRRAIEAAGYNPLRIDQEDNVNKIDDDIIASIRQSRFVVADFTHDEEGARGSVYFEAGFAQGIGIPVIFTCREDMVDTLHFDTRQYAHIVWKNADELYDGLLKRIQARIGAVHVAPPMEHR